MHDILVNLLAIKKGKCYTICMKKIIRQNRKTISITVDRKGEVIIKAPQKMKEDLINKFVSEKATWIEKQQKKQEQVRQFKDNFDFDNFVYIFGQKTNPEQFDLSYALDKASHKKVHFDAIYAEMAEQLIDLAKNIASNLGLEVETIKLTKSKRFWGSLDRHKNMKLNSKLIILPKNLIEYVIIHELCHGVELNHSPKFWAVVKKYCPDYKRRKKELELYSFLFD